MPVRPAVAAVADGTRNAKVLAVLDRVNRLSEAEIRVAAAWAARTPLLALMGVRNTALRLLSVEERNRVGECCSRVGVLGYANALFASEPVRPSADGIDLAARFTSSACLSPDWFSRRSERLVEPWVELCFLWDSMAARRLDRRALCALSEDWFGSVTALVEAAACLEPR